jgi:hypothetical protein
MTDHEEKQVGLRRLKEAMADDIVKASDQEILSQFAEDFGSPEANAARMRASFENAVLLANKDRLYAARAGLAAREASDAMPAVPIGEARNLVRQVLAEHANDETFTLAARKESELSDDDILDMLEAMRELGLLK